MGSITLKSNQESRAKRRGLTVGVQKKNPYTCLKCLSWKWTFTYSVKGQMIHTSVIVVLWSGCMLILSSLWPNNPERNNSRIRNYLGSQFWRCQSFVAWRGMAKNSLYHNDQKAEVWNMEEAKGRYSPKDVFLITLSLQLGPISYLYYLTITLRYYCNPHRGINLFIR